MMDKERVIKRLEGDGEWVEVSRMMDKERVIKKLEGDGEWVKIGMVGVDSGQLIICDPCYIDSQWKNKDVKFNNKLVVVNTGKTTKKPNGFNGLTYESIYKPLKMTYNDAINKGLLKEIPEEPTGEFSYDGCCKATISNLYGQLDYELGHSGVGVAFNSGLGDGVYEVWALIKDDKEWGRRIKEVKIILIEDE